MSTINTPIEQASKIRRGIVPTLKHLGIKNIRGLLFHFPARYEDFSNLKPIGEINLGEIVTIQGKIKKIESYRSPKKHIFITEAVVEDESGTIKATWFNQPFLARNFQLGVLLNLSGKVTLGPHGKCLQNPAYEKNTEHRTQSTNKTSDISQTNIHTGGLVAIYPETEGITSRWLRFLIKSFIEFRREVTEPLPAETRQKHGLLEIKEALRAIHFPRNLEEAKKARERFSFQSLLLTQLRALQEKLRLKQHLAPAITLDLSLIKKFVSSLPFELTNAQRRSIWEIAQDLAKPRPMNRLLEGDVGSGKTVVAAAASLLCAASGFKTAFMAPTEILANQHFATLQKILTPFEIKIGLLTSSSKKIAGNPEIMVGTHALIHPVRNQTPQASADATASHRISNGVQKRVKLENLGLVVVDEQHRFGVEQRAALLRDPNNPNTPGRTIPHFLSMSATPIPRTLALTIYGDLDLSILDEMPKSRKIIITKIVEPSHRAETYQFIREEVQKSRQVFVICPRIEVPDPQKESKKFQQKLLWADVKAVKEEYKKLAEEIFLDFKVGMLHGKMKTKEKETIMRRFKNKELDILVSTSVVEVGVDIPNATIMMIESAERFGLATLHQFRGRVGRGADQSYCFLFPSEDGLIAKRLRAVVEAKNGFELAEKDLEIRGPGDIFGIRQWGISSSVLAALSDPKLVREVRKEAVEILKKDPSLKIFPALQKSLAESEKTLHLE